MSKTSWRISLLLPFLLPYALAKSCWHDIPCSGPSHPAFSGAWDDNNFSPSSRTVYPTNFFPLNRTSDIRTYPSAYRLIGNASAVVYDFRKAVGGIATITYSTAGDSGRLGLAFSEAKNWIGLASDSSNGPFAHGIGDQACGDGAIYNSFSGGGKHTFTMELEHLRGSFRYMTAFLLTNGSTSLNMEKVSLEIAFAPTWSNLQAYQGYFHSSDAELNNIWYAGAYTLQMNVVPSNTGRWSQPLLTTGWANNATLSNGTTAIVDGAKRDRTVWPGDMGIAVPAAFYSLGDLESVHNALQGLYDHQAPDGELPFAGPPLVITGGDVYHCWVMVGTYNYVLYSNDMDFLAKNWAGYQKAMDFIYAKVSADFGLLDVTGTGDWGRLYSSGMYSEASMVLYKTLATGAELALWLGDAQIAETYTSRAEKLKRNVVKHFYDISYGAFRDNLTITSVFPQDANSMSVALGLLANTSSRAVSVSQRLTENWTPIGAETPELPDNISPFISSFEIQAHFAVGATSRALDLIKRSWGWYLSNPNGTASTLIEGYLTNGSFGYRNYDGYDWDSSYTSHTHGWSAGPTSALTEFVVGLSVTGRAGSEWKLAPQVGSLSHVEGGFTTSLGKFQATWMVRDSGNNFVLEWSVPKGTAGTVVVPGLPGGGKGTVFLNGKQQGSVGEGGQFVIGIDGGERNKIVVRKS